MKRRRRTSAHPFRMSMLVALVLLPVLPVMGGCGSLAREVQYTGEHYNPVDADMLIDAEFTGRTGGSTYDDLQWTFDDSSFEIIAGASGMPSDIAQTLLPDGTSADRITGSWSVDGEELTLSDISADGTPVNHPPTTIRTMCTPVIRIQPRSAQYMFRRGSADNR